MAGLTKPWTTETEPTQHADQVWSFTFSRDTDCLTLNDARECACLEAGCIAGRRLIDSRE